MNSLHERLQGIARNVFADEQLVLHDATTPSDVPGWDSLAYVNFVYSVEEEFDVELSDEEFVDITDIRALKRLLERKGVG